MKLKINKQITYKTFVTLLLIGILTISQFAVFSQNAKVVGYLPTYRFDYNTSISYCKVTHLNICFANPDSDGNLQIDNFTEIMDSARAQNPNIVICISVGGGGLDEAKKQIWSDLIDKPANRPAFISKIIDFVESNNLDGVDVDLEWSAITSGYTGFVISLSDSLHTAGKIMTSALPGTYRYPEVTDAVLQANDFINLMAYDETGPWNPNKPGQHSSYDFAVRSINFWKNRGVPGDKLTLGVPFYGYNFGGNNVTEFRYASVVNIDTKYADLDQMKTAYYNGRPTIRKKVELASQKVSGIMIWELAQDRFDEYSLLTTIHDKYAALGFTTTGLCKTPTNTLLIDAPQIVIYPNPATSVVYIENINPQADFIKIYNLTGKEIQTPQNIYDNKTELNISGLNSGIYIIRITGDSFSESKKLIINNGN